MERLYNIFKDSSGISTDTRTITQGTFFIALKGENFDANNMVDEALNKGAFHVVTTNKKYASLDNVTVVDDTLTTLQQLAAYHRTALGTTIVGITGTNGKTTTKELIATVLSKKYKTYATQGNLNNHIGVPLSLLNITKEHDIAVIEMGANHPGEIATLAALVKPNSGLITNVGMAHIEGFGSFEGVKKTKAELYSQIKKDDGTIFINTSNPYLTELLGDYDKCFSYATDSISGIIGGHVAEKGETLNLEWNYNNGQYFNVNTQITGAYNLENVLAAVAVGCFYNVSNNDICEAISLYKPTNSRSQIVITDRNRIIMDAYNANPSSMNASLDNFNSLDYANKVVILGAMRELGIEQYNQHNSIIEKLDKMNLDKVFLVGKEWAEFKTQYPKFTYVEDALMIKEDVEALSKKNILIKGSRSNKLERTLEWL
jgi:UDP-N-acetylmuramoyl-tripeptide--D-alanyl-D-alanine ligase